MGRHDVAADDPLSDGTVEQVLQHIPGLTIGVLGDLFLDRYLDLDASLTEPSLETGLDAYQVVRVRASPGAAGLTQVCTGKLFSGISTKHEKAE